jgi:hypothetical protein
LPQSPKLSEKGGPASGKFAFAMLMQVRAWL